MTALASPSVRRAMLVVGVLLHLGVAVFPLSASGLLAPAWAIAALYAVWAALGWTAWRRRHTAPWAPAVAAGAMLLLWFATMTLGDLLLGWTA